jgi:hypothetical protein
VVTWVKPDRETVWLVLVNESVADLVKLVGEVPYQTVPVDGMLLAQLILAVVPVFVETLTEVIVNGVLGVITATGELWAEEFPAAS